MQIQRINGENAYTNRVHMMRRSNIKRWSSKAKVKRLYAAEDQSTDASAQIDYAKEIKSIKGHSIWPSNLKSQLSSQTILEIGDVVFLEFCIEIFILRTQEINFYSLDLWRSLVCDY